MQRDDRSTGTVSSCGWQPASREILSKAVYRITMGMFQACMDIHKRCARAGNKVSEYQHRRRARPFAADLLQKYSQELLFATEYVLPVRDIRIMYLMHRYRQ